MKISRVSEMRAMDRTAIERYGISPELLMENAGHAAYYALRQEFGIDNKRFLIFCGLGNNGGDGFVLARKLHSDGGRVQVMILGDPGKLRGPAKTNYDILTRLSVAVRELQDLESARSAIAECELIIDAIFGTGLSRDVEGLHREIIQMINGSYKPVLSIDIPSGVHGDTGKIMGVAVKANVTVTFGLPKLGNVLSPGYELGGKLYVSHISFPPSLHQSDSLKIAIHDFSPPIFEPQRITSGKVLTIGGDSRDLDGPPLSIVSFLQGDHGDSGHVTTSFSDSQTENQANHIGMISLQRKTPGSLLSVNIKTLLQLVENVDMVFLGPGLSQQEEAHELVRELARKTEKPILIEGDGMAAFYEDVGILQNRNSANLILSQLDEMSRITSKPRSEIDGWKVDILQETTAHLNSIIVLKGLECLVGFPDQRVLIQTRQDWERATPNSYEALRWAIAVLYCQGFHLDQAAQHGVFLHTLAGALVAQSKGMDQISADEILDHLSLAMNTYRDGWSSELKERFTVARIV